MKAYGLSRREAGDVDVEGCRTNGRAGRTHNLPGKSGVVSEYRGLRNGKRAKNRRVHKRRARMQGKLQCTNFEI